MQPPKPIQPPMASSLSRPAAPKSLPPPKPISQSLAPGVAAGAVTGGAVSIGPASVPPPRAAPSSVPPSRVPPPSIPPPSSIPAATMPTPAVPAPVPQPSASRFYVRVGDEVRNLDIDELRQAVRSGEFEPGTFICRVGDTAWSTIADARDLDLGPMPELASVTTVYESELVVAPTERPRASLWKRSWEKVRQTKNKGPIAAWTLVGIVGLSVVLQRNGALHSAASFVGQAARYEALETKLIGGPGAGTVRSAEKLWADSIPAGSVPFSEVEARVRSATAEQKTPD